MFNYDLDTLFSGQYLLLASCDNQTNKIIEISFINILCNVLKFNSRLVRF